MDALISHFLDRNGDGSGDKEAVGDFSASPVEFFIQPPTTQRFRLTRFVVTYSDGPNWSPSKYGRDITLTNGIKVEIRSPSELVHSFTDPDYPVMANGDWAALCNECELVSMGASSIDLAISRWDFKGFGQMLFLYGEKEHRFTVVLHDDFSDLISQRFMIQGYEVH